MRRVWLSLGALALTASTAAAGPPAGSDSGDPSAEAFQGPPELGKGRSFSQRIEEQLTLLGDSVNGHVGALTLDTVKFRIDGHARRAHLRIHGETRYLAFKLEGDMHFRSGGAQVAATVDLRVVGHAISVELPDFELMPRSYLGERYVEVRVPIIRGSF